MPIYVDETTPTEELCRCGRLKKKIHCPMCGGYSILGYGQKRDVERVLPNGDRIKCATFRCRRCCLEFDDLQWRVTCEAPKFETRTMRQRRTEELARTSFQDTIASHGGDRIAALRDLFAKVKPKTNGGTDERINSPSDEAMKGEPTT